MILVTCVSIFFECCLLGNKWPFTLQNWKNFTNSDLQVDFVLAYDEQGKQEHIAKRVAFETNLQNTGLILEREINQRIHFVKINVPKGVLCRYAEILRLRLPIKDVGNKLLNCPYAVYSTFLE